MSMVPLAEPTKAKVPQGLMATVDTFAPSLVSNIHRPARLRPQNQVLAKESFLCAVTTLSHPVIPLTSASWATFLARSFLDDRCQMGCFPGSAPIPPSRLRELAMHVISGALISSRVVVGPWARAEVDRIPYFLAFLRILPWLSSVLCPSRRILQPQRLLSLPPLRSHLLPASAPSKSEGRNSRQVTGAACPLLVWRIRGIGENGVSSNIHDLSELSRPLVTITDWP